LEGLRWVVFWFLLLLPITYAQTDSYPPVFVFEQPSSELLLSDNLQIKIRVVDESGINVESIRLQLDNGAIDYRWESGCLVVAETGELEEGWHTLKVSAEDLAGNFGWAVLRFKVVFPERKAEILSENLVVRGGEVSVSLLLRNPKTGRWEEPLHVKLDGVENTFVVSVPPLGTQLVETCLPVKDMPPGIYTMSVLREMGDNIGSRTVRLIRVREGFHPVFLFAPVVGVVLVLVLFLKIRKRKPTQFEETAGPGPTS
jgi:hypothetical protein